MGRSEEAPYRERNFRLTLLTGHDMLMIMTRTARIVIPDMEHHGQCLRARVAPHVEERVSSVFPLPTRIDPITVYQSTEDSRR